MTLRTLLPFVLSSVLALFGSQASAAEFDPNATSLVEESKPEPLLRFKYRLVPSVGVSSTTVEADGKAIKSDATAYADNSQNFSALMILIDNSQGSRDFPRVATLEANKKAVAEILNSAQPRLKIGLSTFANDLVTVAPIGAPISEIRAALPKIKPDGLGTRLYLRAMDAIAQLAKFPAERKGLLIFSDGKDEDTGYTLGNLVEAAKKENIIVLAVGCPERPQDIPALGNLEKLAAETYGFYVPMQLASTGGRTVPNNPPKLAESLLNSLDGGGEVTAPLKDVAPGATIKVELVTKEGQKLEKELQRAAPPAPSPSPSPIASPFASPLPSPGQKSFEPDLPAKRGVAMSTWLIIGAAALAALAIVAAVAMASGKKNKKPAPVAELPLLPSQAATARSAALAYLVLQDASSTKLAVTKTASRIGRRSDNDIVFSNDSVSGHHAELHMGRDGAFSITDLGSGNGVLVNGARVTQSALRDGDNIELGEVRFRFTVAG